MADLDSFFKKKDKRKKKAPGAPAATTAAAAAPAAADAAAPAAAAVDKGAAAADGDWIELEDAKAVVNTGGRTVKELNRYVAFFGFFFLCVRVGG